LESRVQADSAAITPIVKRGLYTLINSSSIEKSSFAAKLAPRMMFKGKRMVWGSGQKGRVYR
jgi:hypothetical protein